MGAMKRAMKAKAKAMKKAMKPMKKKKVVSKIAKGKLARSMVFKGSKAKTVGGLTKAGLIKSTRGKVVSKAASARSKGTFATSKLKVWGEAVKQARKALGIKGFVPVGGSNAQGKALLAKVRAIVGKK